jgi:hypothetical protein
VNPKDPISTIPRAPVDSLDLDSDADEAQWERDVMAQAARRIASSRARLERLGIISEFGEIVDRQLPPDMQPGSNTSLETG